MDVLAYSSRPARWLTRLPLVLASLLGASPSMANGRFPAAGQIVIDPSDPGHLLVRATYGFLTTRDGGGTWDWVCEEAVGYSGTLDPPVAITADGSIIAGVFDGLAVSHGDSCGWALVGGDLASRYMVDVSVERNDPSSSIAISSNGLGGGIFQTRLWESPDDAATWVQAGADLPESFLALTVDVAPSDATRVYASGLVAMGAGIYVGATARSLDRGATWETVTLPGTDSSTAPYLAAVDPADADLLYARLDGEPGKLLRSVDGAQTWHEIFISVGALKGFALSPDGATLLVGGEKDGIHRAARGGVGFEKVSDIGAQCLTWNATGVYACASEFVDAFTIGLSTDAGATFTPVMHLPCVRGPLACGPETEVGAECPAQWPATAATLDQPSCSGTGGGGATSGTGAGTGGGPAQEVPPDEGCGCRQPGHGGGRAPVLLAVVVFGLASARRRHALGGR